MSDIELKKKKKEAAPSEAKEGKGGAKAKAAAAAAATAEKGKAKKAAVVEEEPTEEEEEYEYSYEEGEGSYEYESEEEVEEEEEEKAKPKGKKAVAAPAKVDAKKKAAKAQVESEETEEEEDETEGTTEEEEEEEEDEDEDEEEASEESEQSSEKKPAAKKPTTTTTTTTSSATATSAAPATVQDAKKQLAATAAARKGTLSKTGDSVYELLSHSRRNDVKKVKKLVEAVGIDSTDYDQRTALHLAAAEAAYETIVYLVEEAKAPVNPIDRHGRSPLDDAIVKGDAKVINYLREHGALTGPGGGHDQKMIYAATRGDSGAIALLLSAGVDVNSSDYDGRTPLHLAVANGHVKIIEQLIAAGGDPTREDRWGVSPLKEAKGYLSRVGQTPVWDALTKNLATKGGADHRPSIFQPFWIAYGVLWLIVIVLISVFGKYARAAGGFRPPYHIVEGAGDAHVISNAERGELTDIFLQRYPMFQDVHVMIFIGFGLLMSFLRHAGYTAIGITYLLAAFVLAFYHLPRAVWLCAFSPEGCDMPLALDSILLGEFCAGSLLIAFGVVIGRVSPNQMLLMAVMLPILYSLNEMLGSHKLGPAVTTGGLLTDIGGTMTIHMFGAVFGLVFSRTVLSEDQKADPREKNSAVYHSDLFAMIGTVFLWMYWPSFNAAPAPNAVQANRAVVTTYFSIISSCVTTFLASYALRREKRFAMVDVQNASLAGGVAIGAIADLDVTPGAAMGIGAIAGLVSVLGYVHVQPRLERSLGLRDTCGVNNLHGMPSVIGAFASLIAVSVANTGNDAVASPMFTRGPNGALVQFAYIGMTIGIAGIGGFVTGLIGRLKIFQPLAADRIFTDQGWWETPTVESPYFHDLRGEVARGLANEVAAVEHEGTKMSDEIDKVAMRLRKLEEGLKELKKGN